MLFAEFVSVLIKFLNLSRKEKRDTYQRKRKRKDSGNIL